MNKVKMGSSALDQCPRRISLVSRVFPLAASSPLLQLWCRCRQIYCICIYCMCVYKMPKMVHGHKSSCINVALHDSLHVLCWCSRFIPKYRNSMWILQLHLFVLKPHSHLRLCTLTLSFYQIHRIVTCFWSCKSIDVTSLNTLCPF